MIMKVMTVLDPELEWLFDDGIEGARAAASQYKESHASPISATDHILSLSFSVYTFFLTL